MPNRGNQQRLTMDARLKVYEFLKTVLVPLEDGFFKYMDDWTDAKVAARFDTGESAVVNTRIAGFGQLQAATIKGMHNAELLARIESLERRNASMLSALETQGRTLQHMQATVAGHNSNINRMLDKLASLLE